MDDGSKIAAAILAAEASRAYWTLNPPNPNTQYNINGSLLGHYRSFLAEIRKDDPVRVTSGKVCG
jgi:hypothetical protein